jgi:type III pantothenate kinase
MSFLAIDVGNTRLKWALFSEPAACALLLRQGVVFLEHVDSLAEQDWAGLPAPTSMLGCAVAGDAVRRRIEQQMEAWDVTPRWVVPGLGEAGVSNGYDHPSRLGADRWVAVVGAHQHMLSQAKTNGTAPCAMVVVMVGTAVTVDAVDASGKFMGGLILPGHGIMLRSLTSGTAGLHVPTGEVCDFPTNTSDALTSGGTFAITGAIEHSFAALAQHAGHEPLCVMTGGAGWKVSPHLRVPHQLIDNLIFDGLLAIGHVRRDEAQTPLTP